MASVTPKNDGATAASSSSVSSSVIAVGVESGICPKELSLEYGSSFKSATLLPKRRMEWREWKEMLLEVVLAP